jgi:hypothetical protein
MMQETVLVHNRIYSLLETVGRTNPAIDWNTTPSPDYSKLKLGDNVGESASLAITAGRIGDNSRDHDDCNGQRRVWNPRACESQEELRLGLDQKTKWSIFGATKAADEQLT